MTEHSPGDARSSPGDGPGAEALAPAAPGSLNAPSRPPGPERIGDYLRRNSLWGLGVAAAFGVLFFPAARNLVQHCLAEEDDSHCLLIPFLSGGLIFARRRSIAGDPVVPSRWGLPVLLLSLLVFIVGYLLNNHTFQRSGMVGGAVGAAVHLLGDAFRKGQRFPLLYLFLAVPLPYVIHQRIGLDLKAFATRLSTGFLSAAGVPVLSEGNVLAIEGNRLDVADACSGIRSLVAILAVVVLFAHLVRGGLLPGALLLMLSIPVVVLVNSLRIFLIGILLYRFEIDLTRGAVHDSMGLLIFLASLGGVYLGWLFIRWLLRLDPAGDGMHVPRCDQPGHDQPGHDQPGDRPAGPPAGGHAPGGGAR